MKKTTNHATNLPKLLQALEAIAEEPGGGLTTKYLSQKAGVNENIARQYIGNHKEKVAFGFKITQIYRGQYSVAKAEEKLREQCDESDQELPLFPSTLEQPPVRSYDETTLRQAAFLATQPANAAIVLTAAALQGLLSAGVEMAPDDLAKKAVEISDAALRNLVEVAI